jgi:prepilin-type N-terminal cleavage/methylation domain-containing protein
MMIAGRGSLVNRLSPRWRPSGFTLIELLTAMAIVTLLAGISVPIILSIIQGDKIRDASSSVQAAITAARERAALDNRPTGIRLVSDPNNPELVRQIVFIREADPIAPGGSVTGGAMVTDAASRLFGSTQPFFDTVEIAYDPRFVATLVNALPRELVRLQRYSAANFQVVRGLLRINGTGTFRAFSYFAGTAVGNAQNRGLAAPFTGTEQRTLLVLDGPLDAGVIDPATNATLPVSATGIRIEIARPPVPLEGAEPLNLPQGMVIDLGQLPRVDTSSPTNVVTPTVLDASTLRLSRITPRLSFGNLVDRSTGATDFGFDIMFGSDRNVIGSAAVDDRVILWMRDENSVQTDSNPNVPTQAGFNLFRKEVRADSSESSSLVVLSTRTGQLGTYKPILVDENGDGFADWDQYYRNVEEGIGVNP